MTIGANLEVAGALIADGGVKRRAHIVAALSTFDFHAGIAQAGMIQGECAVEAVLRCGVPVICCKA